MAGITAVVSEKNCVEDLYLSDHLLQHRAQDYSALALEGEKNVHTHKGLLSENFPIKRRMGMSGNMGMACVSSYRQPVSELSRAGGLVTAIDGNITNYEQLKNDLLKSGMSFSGYHYPKDVSDAVLASKIISSKLRFEEGIEALVDQTNGMKGDFAIVSMVKDGIYAARGWGRKPLILGEKERSYAVSSESNSFENTGFEIVRDVEPGEIVFIDTDGIHHVKKLDLSPIKYGTFEWIYTAYPPSRIDGRYVGEVRETIGELLAEQFPVEGADVVSPVPNSGRWHAIGFAKGFAKVSGAHYTEVFVRYDYSGRSFTKGEQGDRDEEARTKLIPMRHAIKGKVIVLVDDSIVRGTQMLNRVKVLRELGAKEIHARIACMALEKSCMYGKTTKEDAECIARRMSKEDIRESLELDSLEYATVEILEEAIGYPREKLCLECWGLD